MTNPIDLNDPIAVLLAVASSFRGAGLEAVTYGGLALAVYGEPRETKDADLAVAGIDGRAGADALRATGIEAQVAFDRMKFGGNFISRITVLPGAESIGLNVVDLVEPRSLRYARVVLDRALTGTLRSESIRIVSPEDFVVLKVLSTRERDLEDAAIVMRTLGTRFGEREAAEEIARLASEISDHPVHDRFDRVLALARAQ